MYEAIGIFVVSLAVIIAGLMFAGVINIDIDIDRK